MEFRMDITSMMVGLAFGAVAAAIYYGRQRRDTKHRKKWDRIRRGESASG